MERDDSYEQFQMQDTILPQTNTKSTRINATQRVNRQIIVTLIVICSLLAGMLTYIMYVVTTKTDTQQCDQEQHEQRPDICSGETDPCSGHGRCLVTETSYRCECYDGLTGPGCHTTIKLCVSNPCVNGGSCDDVTNGYTCQCQDGYTGMHCETVICEALIFNKEAGGCVQLFTNPKTWHDAEAECQKQHITSHLVTITDDRKQQALNMLADSVGEERYYTGGRATQPGSDIFRWTTTGDEMTYTNWHNDEPNNYEGTNEDCIVVQKWDKFFKWNDTPCTETIAYICELQ